MESAVNFVGVDLNTASKHLLQYVSGISATLASNIVQHRLQHGAFKTRDELKKVASPKDTTSAFYGVIDRRSFTLQFCSAGNMDGYYMVPHKPIQVLKSTNSAFGQQFSEKLTMAALELDPKSRICLVSDGLSEVLGADGVVKIMGDNAKGSVHELRNELLFQAQRKSGLEEPLKDQTVIVVEVKDRVIKLAK